MQLKIFIVEHGACAMVQPPAGLGALATLGPLAVIDCGDNTSTGWTPSTYIRNHLRRTQIDYLFVTNADQDHVSDLDGIVSSGINVNVLYRNPTPDAAILRIIKEAGGPLTSDMEQFLALHGRPALPAGFPTYAGLKGITYAVFYNQFPDFIDTNNLSLAVFLRYAGFKILFPGDLEVAGWQKLLENPAFVAELRGTNILVVSHHGRESGLCTDIFDYFTPQAVVISDDSHQYDTQDTVATYSYYVSGDGIAIQGSTTRRRVLTTRSDGNILFRVGSESYTVETEHG